MDQRHEPQAFVSDCLGVSLPASHIWVFRCFTLSGCFIFRVRIKGVPDAVGVGLEQRHEPRHRLPRAIIMPLIYTIHRSHSSYTICIYNHTRYIHYHYISILILVPYTTHLLLYSLYTLYIYYCTRYIHCTSIILVIYTTQRDWYFIAEQPAPASHLLDVRPYALC